MRSRSFVTVTVLSGVLASVFALALALTTNVGGLSPRPAEAASRVEVTARCDGNPERVIVRNNTRHRITVRRVGSIYRPYDFEPITVNRKLRRGRAITFQSGPAAKHNVLTKQYIFNSDVGSREGARVSTSVGGFGDRCN